ncbi:MAG TPA: DoxX family membrane protein [Longimicrobium sp.]|nr:DoxX family membrane protein [Longimicrobium sp.]
MAAKAWTLLLLRISLGLFLVAWGMDKLVNVEHGQAVSEGFYLGLFSAPTLLRIFGVAQVVAGAMVVLGLGRRVAYPFLIAVTGFTLLAVWKSVIDPLGLFLEGGNLVFFASAVIFPASLLLWAFRDEDAYALDRRGSRESARAPAPALR